MIRSLAVSLSLLLALSAHAAADLGVSASVGRLAAGGQAEANVGLFVGNSGPDTSGPIRLRITLPAPLQADLRVFQPDWTCAPEGDSILCTREPLLAQRGDSRNFVIRANGIAAGTHIIEFSLDEADDPNPANNRRLLPLQVFELLNITSDADSGPGTLRAAIEYANANCGAILCRIVGPQGGEMLIRPLTPLPPITACNVELHAGSFSIYTQHRAITLDGSLLSEGNGLEVRTSCPAGTSGVSISGFAIGNFPENGIELATQDEDPRRSCHSVFENAIGLDRFGVEPRPNLRGISLASPRTCAQITRNWIAANRASGVAIWAASSATLLLNHIGWGGWLTPHPNPNGASGVFIGADDVQLLFNNIAFNYQFGVSIAPGVKRPSLQQNTIHSNVEPAIDWGLDRETPNDADETDGIPNKPRITSVTTREVDLGFGSKEIRATVHGVVRSRTGVYGSRFFVTIYRNGGPGLYGRFEAYAPAATFEVRPNAEGVFEQTFQSEEFRFVQRGNGFTAQLQVTSDNGSGGWTSELSDPVVIP